MTVKNYGDLWHITLADLIEIEKTLTLSTAQALPVLRGIRDRLKITDRQVLRLVSLVKTLDEG